MSGVQKLPPILNQETMKRISPWQNGSQEKDETPTPKPDHKETSEIRLLQYKRVYLHLTKKRAKFVTETLVEFTSKQCQLLLDCKLRQTNNSEIEKTLGSSCL
jgi:hypothetical protein